MCVRVRPEPAIGVAHRLCAHFTELRALFEFKDDTCAAIHNLPTL